MADEILQSMLDDVDSKYDKRPGSFIYDSLAPSSIELSNTKKKVDAAIDKINISNLEGQELEDRIFERSGITRKQATYSNGYVNLVGTGTINEGDLFETVSGIQYKSTETKYIENNGTVNIVAVEPGQLGNTESNTITLFPITLATFTEVNNPESTTNGFDAESDEDLLIRYFQRVQTPSTSGNKYHYINWAKEVQGVGETKVYPIWNGPGTVKVVIIDSTRQMASAELVTEVEQYIEENRPIGSNVTVVSGTEKTIDITANIVLSNGYTIEQVELLFENEVIDYFKDIAFKSNYVSYAKIGTILLNTEGIEDYSDLQIELNNINIALGDEEFAVLGTIVLGVL